MNKNELLNKLNNLNEIYLSESQIVKLCGKEINYNASTINKLLMDLVESGDVILTERHKFAVTGKTSIVKGKFIGNIKGFGFVERVSEKGDDLFIPEKSVNGAIHGDMVLVRVVPRSSKRNGKNFRNFNNEPKRSTEGEIVRILKRELKTIVGTFSLFAGGAVVYPDDKRFADQVFILADGLMGAKTNQKVVVEIQDYPSRNQMATGKIVEILGDINDLGVDTLSIIRAYGLTEKFSEEVMLEAKSVAHEPNAGDKKGRTDYTNDLVITIDGDDARDFDDAISLVKTEDGGYNLKVHIADVSHYVTQDSEIDKEAFNRGTSVYFPDMVLPMLPEDLCNNICSLKPDVERLTLSVEILFDSKGNIKDYNIAKGVIKSHNRMTYNNVTKIFNGDKAVCQEYKHLIPMLMNMKELAELLIKRRDNAGQLDFNLPEVQIDMDENNKIKDIYRKPRNISERIIEQFMVVTNEVVARHITNLQLPFVYRIHEVPSLEKMHAFNDCVKGLGLNLSIQEIEPKPRDVQKVIMAVKGRPMETVINSILLRSMQKAKYAEMPIGHFGLALADYCHFTSPIRRYPDLTIHRIIKLALDGKMVGSTFNFYEDFVVQSAEQSSAKERLADEAERAVDDLKKAEYMTKFIGEEFTGMVSGLTENGIFVQLENTVEGMVMVEDLPQDKYTYDEAKWMLVGSKNTFKLGQTIKIKVFSTDLILRKVNFVLAEDWKIKL